MVDGQLVSDDVLQVPAARSYKNYGESVVKFWGGVVLVRFDKPELQRAEREDLLCDLLAQARHIHVLHVSQQMFNA